MLKKIKNAVSSMNSFMNKMADAPIEMSIPVNSNYDHSVARNVSPMKK